MRRAIRQKKDVQKAMCRKGIGQVDFLWGNLGVKAENWAHGAGISHVSAKHARDLYKIPITIAKGKITSHPRDPDKYIIRHENVLVFIKKKIADHHWW